MADPHELMARYCDGDAGAFRELYDAIAPALFGYLIRMARHRAQAADLLQHTFLKVHRARGAYIRGADPVPWIYAIAHRTFLDEARRHKRGIVQLGLDNDLPEQAADLHGQLASHRREPADPEQLGVALAALAELPPAQREAVVLTRLEGRSAAEAAEIAGTTEGAMRVRVHRGCESLRRLVRNLDAPGAATARAGGAR